MTCPRCQGDISSKNDSLILCSDCGWMPQSHQIDKDNGVQRSCLLAFICFTVATCLLFVHTSTWDEHSIAIITPKVSETLGIASQKQLIQIADICSERMLINCEEDALASALQNQPNDINVLERLANHKMLTKKFEEAFTLYRTYFELGGTNEKAIYKFAGLLAKQGNYEYAEKYYVTLLEKKPGVLQLSVNEAYVSMLMKSGQLNKAKLHIQKLRTQGAPDYFLNHEYAQIQKKLKLNS